MSFPDLKSILLQNIEDLLKDPWNSDVIIRAGEGEDQEELVAHSLILGIRSPYFRTAFSETWAKKENNKFVLSKPNISPDVFKTILRYIYTGEATFVASDVDYIDLLEAADELVLEALVLHIQDHMLENDKHYIQQNFFRAYEASSQHDSFAKLRDYTFALVESNPRVFFDSSDFLRLNQASLQMTVSNPKLEMQEIEIWKKVIEWGRSQKPKFPLDVADWTPDNFTEFEEMLNPIITHVRFFEISSTDYFNHVRPYKKLLSRELRRSLKEFYFVVGSKPPENALPPRTPGCPSMYQFYASSPRSLSETDMALKYPPPPSPPRVNNSFTSPLFQQGPLRSQSIPQVNSFVATYPRNQSIAPPPSFANPFPRSQSVSVRNYPIPQQQQPPFYPQQPSSSSSNLSARFRSRFSSGIK